jgi:outer membrane protein
MTRYLGAGSLLVAASIGTMALCAPAMAADMVAKPVYKAPVVDTFSPWQIRLRALGVITRDSGHVDQVPGSGLATSDALVPELDITYYFTPNIAAELILGVTRHHVTGTGTLSGVDVGKAWLLPPTLTLQYHFTNFGAFKPYIGAGVNYTWFFSQSAGNAADTVTVTRSHLHNSFSPALQIGFDYMIDRHWGLNLDVKKLFLRPDWDGNSVAIQNLTGKVNLDPWLVGGGVTYRF